MFFVAVCLSICSCQSHLSPCTNISLRRTGISIRHAGHGGIILVEKKIWAIYFDGLSVDHRSTIGAPSNLRIADHVDEKRPESDRCCFDGWRR